MPARSFGQDQWIWTKATNDNFSVRSVYWDLQPIIVVDQMQWWLDSNERSQTSNENQGPEIAVSVNGLGDDDVTKSQAAGQSIRWDNTVSYLPERRKGNDQHNPSVLALVKGKGKANEDVNSVVGQQNPKGGDEPEVTSPAKPGLAFEAKDVVGLLDSGKNKESKPKTKAKLKKLVKGKGPSEDTNMNDRSNGLGTNRGSEIELLEEQEGRVTKRIRDELLLSGEQQTMETAVAAGQHRRER
ncbi:hypothetical protein CMV_030424 [Castanea mollissima]|uniref:Uncharacterized protein n=1 Tax=Castanea mollissima TaxID=60419 RepID=A0A8J4Q3Q4_9ROSI|nr:hypothetical protein CMV_030424 [Castanea mollissima]